MTHTPPLGGITANKPPPGSSFCKGPQLNSPKMAVARLIGQSPQKLNKDKAEEEERRVKK